MKRARGRHSFVAGIAALAVPLLLAACGSQADHPVANHAPFVRLTGGPVTRAPGINGIPRTDSVSYSTEFFWTGWDDDGVIDHYQYAIDVPDNLLGKINNPEPAGIAWVDTTAFRAHFLFPTTEQDTTLLPDGTVYEPELYRGDHTFYVRAVDNEGAVSAAAYVSFTARTVTPVTHFTIPGGIKTSQVLQVGRQLRVAWQGLDPDSPDPKKLPAFYEWKLIEIPFAVQVQGDIQFWITDPNGPGPKFRWNRVGADTTHLSLSLNPPQDYILAVRAIDEAGGVESKFFRGQNAVVLSSSERNPGTPTLTVREITAGTFTFPDDGNVLEMETAVGRCLRFDFDANADVYGGVIQGFNYGIDVSDAEQDGPQSGFRGWTLLRFTYEPICFNTPGVHAVTVKVRDTGGGVTVGNIIVKVIGFPRDRELLYIDDFYQNFGTSNDGMMDSRVVDMLTSIGFTTGDGPRKIYGMDVFDAGDVNYQPALVKLSDLARYRYVLWSVKGSAYNANPALVASNACPRGRVLQAYVGAGGAVWIYGQQVMGCFRRGPTGDCSATIGYDENNDGGISFEDGGFVTDFLHVSPGVVFRDVKTRPRYDGLVRAVPTPEAAAEVIPFPPVEMDSTVYNYRGLGGIAFIDAMFTPTTDRTGGLDTVYTVGAAASPVSGWRRRPLALRYADPDPVSPRQGPVAVFGFPFHLLKAGAVEPVPGGADYQGTGTKGMAAAMFAWFRRHTEIRANNP